MHIKKLDSFKHVLILPLGWALAAACWSFPIWKYSFSSYTFVGDIVARLFWEQGVTGDVLGFLASVLEITAIAIALSFLRVSIWIYAVVPLLPLYRVVTFHGTVLVQYIREFGLLSSWSLYLTALLALIAFSLLLLIKRARAKIAKAGPLK